MVLIKKVVKKMNYVFILIKVVVANGVLIKKENTQKRLAKQRRQKRKKILKNGYRN